MTLAAGTRVGAYEIVTLLGAGGVGEVYRARDTKLQRDVALKVLPETVGGDPERIASMERAVSKSTRALCCRKIASKRKTESYRMGGTRAESSFTQFVTTTALAGVASWFAAPVSFIIRNR